MRNNRFPHKRLRHKTQLLEGKNRISQQLVSGVKVISSTQRTLVLNTPSIPQVNMPYAKFPQIAFLERYPGIGPF